ncbi:putative bifunctional diguanylate cyclase/phosphodiesterase [Colwelliaceae bacterium 6441]
MFKVNRAIILRQSNPVFRIKFTLKIILIALSIFGTAEALLTSFGMTAIAFFIVFIFTLLLYFWVNIDTSSTVIGIMLWTITFLTTFLAWGTAGLYNSAIIIYPCIILLALILGEKQLSIPLFLFIQCSVLLFFYAHVNGLINEKSAHDNLLLVRAFDLFFIFLFFYIIAAVFIKDIKRRIRNLSKKNRFLSAQLYKAHQRANYDQLTKLPNEQICDKDFIDSVKAIKKTNEQLAFIKVELQNIKNINHSIGQEIADLLLIEIATRYQLLTSINCKLYRFKSSYFVFVLQAKHFEEMNQLKDQLLHASSFPFNVKDYEIEIFIAIGISIAPFDGMTLESLLKKSNQALQNLPTKGINGFCFYDQSMESSETEHFKMVRDIKSALENQEFTLYHQPKVDLISNRITGAEALIRWKNSQGHYVTPDVFIPIAEESGLIVEITKWVLTQACKDCASWHNKGLTNLNVAVNLSSIDFRRGNLPQIVMKALNDAKLPPHYLELEITESTIIDDISHIQSQIRSLHSKGVTFAIDDFGTGYSNLGYLSQFNVTTLKLDQSFIRKLATSHSDFYIVKAIIEMSKSLGIVNVAEGVETKEIADILLKIECLSGQGYLWSKPIKNIDFIDFAQSNAQIY